MKFGSVVRVCTVLRNHFERTSLRNTAKASGSTDEAMPRKLMPSVFAITCTIWETWVGDETSSWNHCRPTNLLPDSPRAGR